MMGQRFRIIGVDRDSGEPIELLLHADSLDAAVAKARERRVQVRSVHSERNESEPQPLELVPLVPAVDQVHRINTKPIDGERGSRQGWLLLTVVALLALSPVLPRLTTGVGLLLLILCVTSFVPGVRRMSRRLLKLNPQRPWLYAVRYIASVTTGVVLVVSGLAGVQYQAEKSAIAARQAEAAAETRRLIDEANVRVRNLAMEADDAWKRGDAATALAKLKTASEIPKANDLKMVQRLRTQMANAEVVSILSEATDAAKAGNIELANEKTKAALSLPYATELGATQQLAQQLSYATDATLRRAILTEMPEEAFVQLRDRGMLPEMLASGIEAVDRATARQVRAEMPEIEASRAQRKREELERERLALEAAKKAAEAKRLADRQRKIENSFSAWDGSHHGLEKHIKAAMDNPKSYEHVETVYWDMGEHLIVRTTFRGTNAFGGVIKNWIKAKVDLDGNVLAITGQGS